MRRYVAHLMGEHVRFAHHHNVRAGGRLSDYTINLHGRVLQRILGHSTREMVEHYMRLADTAVTQLHRRHSPLDHL